MIYKTFWPRVAAAFLDTILLWPLLLLQMRTDLDPLGWVSIIILVLQHSYYIIGHAQFGRTLGKRLLRLRVVRAHEHLPVTWMEALRREALWIALSIVYLLPAMNRLGDWAAVPGGIIVLADALVALIHPRNRSIRDFIAGTVVINERQS